MKEKIAVAILTKDREDSFQKCYNSIPQHIIDELIIINDGDPYSDQYTKYNGIIQNPKNVGVCKSKNLAFKRLQKQNPDFYFLIEDDIIIKDPTVFQRYINTYKETGIHNLMYGFHGPINKGGISHGTPRPRLSVEYTKSIGIDLNAGCVGAFCFYTKECLDAVGLFDEKFYQAFDHVEHTYRIHKAGMTTGYWWWADIKDSWKYLDEVACSEESSTIRFKDPQKWRDNIQNAITHFKSKHGYAPAWQDSVPDTAQTDVLIFLKELHAKNRIK